MKAIKGFFGGVARFFFRFVAAGAVFIALLILVTALLGSQMPGDFCSVVLPDRTSSATLAQCRRRQPLPHERILYTLKHLGRGSLGISLVNSQPVLAEVSSRLAPTLLLAGGTMVFGLALGVPLGLLAALKHGMRVSKAINWGAIGLLAMPGFLLIILLSDLLAGKFRLVSRLYSSDDPFRLALPMLSLGLPAMALILRVTQSITLRELTRDYIRTAKAKGLSSRAILIHHVGRNIIPGLLGVATVLFLELIDGTLLIEAVFSLPGLGAYTALALRRHDYPALQGVLLVIAALTYFVSQSAEFARRRLAPDAEGGH